MSDPGALTHVFHISNASLLKATERTHTNYRIYFGSVWTEAPTLVDAQDIALTAACALTQACGFPVEAKVFRLSGAVMDAAGHRVTPHHLVGTAVGRIEHQNAFIGWQSAPSIKVAA